MSSGAQWRLSREFPAVWLFLAVARNTLLGADRVRSPAVIGLALALGTTTLLLIARWLTQVKIDLRQQANERDRRLEAYYEQRREKAILREIREKAATAHRRTIWRGIR